MPKTKTLKNNEECSLVINLYSTMTQTYFTYYSLKQMTEIQLF